MNAGRSRTRLLTNKLKQSRRRFTHILVEDNSNEVQNVLESKEEGVAELSKVNLNESFELEKLPILARVPSTDKFENSESMHHAV